MSLRIHFHSDASFFAGCENMLVNFFNDSGFMAAHDVSFSYRYSPDYEQGFRGRVTGAVRAYPLDLPDTDRLSHWANRVSFKPFAVIVKIIIQFLKCIYIACNTAILYKFFKKFKIDLLHVNNGGYPGAYSCMSAVFAAKLAGIRRIVYVVNNVAVPYGRPRRWIDPPFDRLVVKSVSVFVTGSAYAGEELRKVLGLPQDKVKNINNGILLRPATENKEQFFRRLGLQEDRLLIGVVAVLEERKGHIYLLQAIRSLRDKGLVERMPYLVIEGQGSLLETLKRYVADAQLDDCVRFIGSEKNISNLMNAMDLLVLPSIGSEDFPNVILEAMGMVKPVVASRICGIPEQVEPMKTGILVEPGDVQGLAQAINTFLKDHSLLRSFGDNARRIFNEKFLASRAVRQYSDLYTVLTPGGDQ